MQLQRTLSRIRRTTLSQRQSWVAKFQASGLTRQEFAEQHGLKLSTLIRWLGESKSAVRPLTPVLFNEVPLSRVLQDSQSWAMEICTPCGLVVRVR